MKNKLVALQQFLLTIKGKALVIIAILLFNFCVYSLTEFVSIPAIQIRADASGFSSHYANEFTYFHYYTGHFPLATLDSNLDYSIEGAKSEIENNSSNLIMEFGHWSRLGENARIWAYLPNAFLAGTPAKNSIKLFNSIVFILSIIILYFGFISVSRPIVGLVLITFINITPFFLFEVYSRENIFALLGSVFFIIVGLNLKFFYKKISFKNAIFLAIISGSVIGFFSEFRNEISIVLVSLLILYTLTKSNKIISKIALITIAVLAFYSSKQTIRQHFEHKYQETETLVKEKGGHVYNGKRIQGHRVWHPLFCGLGDFDTKYGYEWNDKTAYKYATPILQSKYNMDISYSDKYHLDNYYDSDSLYYIKFDEIDEYEIIMKDKVMGQILNDTAWYFQIIIKRIVRTLTVTTPVPLVGWLILFIIPYLFIKRNWFYLKLIIISLPLSATSIIIYSGKGATYNSVFVYFILLSLIVIVYNEIIKKRYFLN